MDTPKLSVNESINLNNKKKIIHVKNFNKNTRYDFKKVSDNVIVKSKNGLIEIMPKNKTFKDTIYITALEKGKIESKPIKLTLYNVEQVDVPLLSTSYVTLNNTNINENSKYIVTILNYDENVLYNIDYNSEYIDIVQNKSEIIIYNKSSIDTHTNIKISAISNFKIDSAINDIIVDITV